MKDILRRLLGHPAPEKQAEHERLARAAAAARQHRERSETRMEESLSRMRRLLEDTGHDGQRRPNGGHAD